MPAKDSDISKYLSYVLRHAPQDIGIVLDAEGWTDYSGLSAKVYAKLAVADADIQRIIAEDPKKRFTVSDGRIRAAQGHSVSVNLEYAQMEPPAVLYHGTTASAWEAIQVDGLTPMQRTHVHLSPDVETARVVAMRRKGPHVLLTIDTAAMAAAGYTFHVDDNGVWLTTKVPPQFLAPLPETNP